MNDRPIPELPPGMTAALDQEYAKHSARIDQVLDFMREELGGSTDSSELYGLMALTIRESGLSHGHLVDLVSAAMTRLFTEPTTTTTNPEKEQDR